MPQQEDGNLTRIVNLQNDIHQLRQERNDLRKELQYRDNGERLREEILARVGKVFKDDPQKDDHKEIYRKFIDVICTAQGPYRAPYPMYDAPYKFEKYYNQMLSQYLAFPIITPKSLAAITNIS